mmetsp:Transcript_16843/g.46235  ORF Transcript_16843/g.46235 Transcript_16843/m.46235 type:complete len:277 (+) Transcript_16843:3313-4143(+)
MAVGPTKHDPVPVGLDVRMPRLALGAGPGRNGSDFGEGRIVVADQILDQLRKDTVFLDFPEGANDGGMFGRFDPVGNAMVCLGHGVLVGGSLHPLVLFYDKVPEFLDRRIAQNLGDHHRSVCHHGTHGLSTGSLGNLLRNGPEDWFFPNIVRGSKTSSSSFRRLGLVPNLVSVFVQAKILFGMLEFVVVVVVVVVVEYKPSGIDKDFRGLVIVLRVSFDAEVNVVILRGGHVRISTASIVIGNLTLQVGICATGTIQYRNKVPIVEVSQASDGNQG